MIMRYGLLLVTFFLCTVSQAHAQDSVLAETSESAIEQVSTADIVQAEPSAEKKSTEAEAAAEEKIIAPTETFRLKQEITREDGTSMGSASLQMTLGLMAVLAVIFGLSWLARRFNLAGVGGVAGMKVSAALNVGQKEKILVLEVENQRLLVGVTAHQISLLQVLGDAPVTSKESDFAHRMQTLLKAGSVDEK